jgi:hypothetical protein
MPKLPEALGTPQDLGAVPPDPSRILPRYEKFPDSQQDTRQAVIGAAQTAIAQADGPASYGPGFWQAFNRVTAPDGEPDEIRDLATLLRFAGPDGSGGR